MINVSTADSRAELTDAEQFIISCIREHPGISARAMAEMRGISPRQIEKHLSEMKLRGILLREGARRNGIWKVCGE